MRGGCLSPRLCCLALFLLLRFFSRLRNGLMRVLAPIGGWQRHNPRWWKLTRDGHRAVDPGPTHLGSAGRWLTSPLRGEGTGGRSRSGMDGGWARQLGADRRACGWQVAHESPSSVPRLLVLKRRQVRTAEDRGELIALQRGGGAREVVAAWVWTGVRRADWVLTGGPAAAGRARVTNFCPTAPRARSLREVGGGSFVEERFAELDLGHDVRVGAAASTCVSARRVGGGPITF